MNDYVPSEILGTLSEVAEIPTVLGPATLTRNNTQTLRLQSLAVVIWLLFREYFRYATTQSLQTVRSYGHTGNMVRFADWCVQGSFVPQIVIRVADWFATFRVRFGVDARTALPDAFRAHRHFWRAYEAYVERQLDGERKRRAKVTKAPHLYMCAASGCLVQAFKKGTLRRCGGDCPPEAKPSYCSAECQMEVSCPSRRVVLRAPPVHEGSPFTANRSSTGRHTAIPARNAWLKDLSKMTMTRIGKTSRRVTLRSQCKTSISSALGPRSATESSSSMSSTPAGPEGARC